MGLVQEWATLKLAKGKGVTTATTAAVVDIKVPGTPGSNEGRVVRGGQAWFDTQHADDYIKVYTIDKDGLIPDDGSRTAYPDYPIIGSFTDDEVDVLCQGFWIPIHQKYIEVRTIGDMGFIPAGFYLRMIGHKGDSSVDTFRTNIEWGKRE